MEKCNFLLNNVIVYFEQFLIMLINSLNKEQIHIK